MIINRAPLYNQNGEIGYFDYSACIYPAGKVEEQVYFFNHENIEKVYFKGYIDEQEELFQQQYEEKIKDVYLYCPRHFLFLKDLLCPYL